MLNLKIKRSTYFILSILLTTLLVLICFRTYQPKPIVNDLIIGTTADFAPFSFIDNEGNIVGFDIDVAKEVAKRLNLNPIIENHTLGLESLKPALKNGGIHIATGFIATPKRKQDIYFTKPFLTGEILVAVTREDTPKIISTSDLNNKRLAVVIGSPAARYSSVFSAPPFAGGYSHFGGLTIEDAFKELDSNLSDAVLATPTELAQYFANNPQAAEKNYNTFIIDEANIDDSLALNFKLDDDLKARIEGILSAMGRDGTLNNLKKKWGLN